MHKWHIHSCIGRGRPLRLCLRPNCALTPSRHYLQTSSPFSQEVRQDQITKDQSQPILSRAQRLQNATSQLENLYYMNAVNSNRSPGEVASRFRSIPLRKTSKNQAETASDESPAAIEGSAGVPSSQATIKAKESTYRFRRLQTGVMSQPRMRSDVVDVSPAATQAEAGGASRDGGSERGPFNIVRNGGTHTGNTNAAPPSLRRKDEGNNRGGYPERPQGRVIRTIYAPDGRAVDEGTDGSGTEGLGSTRDTLMRSFRPEGGFRRDDSSTGPEYMQGFASRREGSFRRDQPRDREGMQERQRFPIQAEDRYRSDQPESEDSIQERASRFVRDAPRRESGFRNEPPRSENGIQERAPRTFGEGQGRSMFNRISRGGGAPQRSGRTGRPRAARDGDETERKPRKGRNARSGGGGGGDRDDRSTFSGSIWNEEEQEYFRQKEKAEAAQSLDFEPASITQETYSGIGPALASGTFGMSEVLGEQLLMAKKYLEGGFIQWDSKEQKADVMTLAESLKTLEEQEAHSQDGEKGKSLSAKTEKQTQELMQKLLGGKYEMMKPQPGKDVLGNVARHINRNESYFPDDQRILLEKVKSILPTETGRGGGKSARRTV